MGSIHQIIGAGPHGFQKQALGGDRFEDRVIVRRGQRMLPPGFLVAAGEHLVVAFQKQDFIVAALALEVVKAVEQVVEQFTAPHIHNDGDFGQLVLRLHAQLREFGQELRRHVIHAVKTDILERIHGAGFTRTGQTGHNDEFHGSILSFPELRTGCFPHFVRRNSPGRSFPIPRQSPARPDGPPAPGGHRCVHTRSPGPASTAPGYPRRWRRRC